MKQTQIPAFSKRILTIVGGYGSGKSEVAVNLCRTMVEDGQIPMTIADLDIVNPYFRSREATERLEEIGIRVVIPAGEQRHADLPIIVPEVKGVIKKSDGWVILDVGGDDAGSRVLSSLVDAFPPDDYEMLLVHNANRPFTADLKSTLKTMDSIETSSRLHFTGIISNTHLMEHTTIEIALDGLRVAREVSESRGVPILMVSILDEMADDLASHDICCPVLPLRRWLVKPWEKAD